MIKKIGFKGYKLFKGYNEIEIGSITVLIGKNSSGKSSLTKLMHILPKSFDREEQLPISLSNDDVELGVEFRDLVYGRSGSGYLEIMVKNDNQSFKFIVGNKISDAFIPILLEAGKVAYSGNLDLAGFEESHYDFFESNNLTYNSDYIGPIRKTPKRFFSPQTIKGKYKSGKSGENAYNEVVNLFISGEKELLGKIDEWYKENFDGWGIKVNDDKAPAYQLQITNQENFDINIVDAGQGMSQLFPIVTRAFIPCKEETLIIIEQPELHLHPAAHGDVAELLVTQSKEDPNKHFLVETHSQNFLLRIRRLIAEGRISNKRIKFYFIDYDHEQKTSTVKPIKLNEIGEVDYWPDGIFNEDFEEAMKLSKAQKR